MFEEIAQDEDKRGSDANYEIAANKWGLEWDILVQLFLFSCETVRLREIRRCARGC